MAKTVYIGIDNGVTGSIGIISSDGDAIQLKTPITASMNYSKTVKRMVNKIDYKRLTSMLSAVIKDADIVKCRLERPFINPKFFHQSLSASRSDEITGLILNQLGIGFDYIDSTKWQRSLFPPHVAGRKELKIASNVIGKQLYPLANVDNHEDYDGLLIAEYLRKQNNGE